MLRVLGGALLLFCLSHMAFADEPLFGGSNERIAEIELTVSALQADMREAIESNSRKLDELLGQRSSPPYRASVEEYVSPTQYAQPMMSIQPVYSVGVKRGGLTRQWVPLQPIRNVARLFGVTPYTARGVVSPVGSPFAIGG